MLSFVRAYAANYVFSQNGEEGILLECVKRLGIAAGIAVEIGGHDGRFCSNTALLADRHQWEVTFVEASWPLYLQCKENWSHRPDVECICSRVDGQNVNAFVTDECDLLSIDTDGADFEIFKGLKAKPKIVIVEIDSSIAPNLLGERAVNVDGGVGYLPMLTLGLLKGYRLLAHTGNLIFILDEYRYLFPELNGVDPVLCADRYFNRSWLKAA